jgi:squalene-hopene/tetraprenyl-beta-curcumene cyclase
MKHAERNDVTTWRSLAAAVALGAASMATVAPAQSATPAFPTAPLAMQAAPAANAQDPAARAQALIDKGLAYLKSQQKPDGGWAGEKEPPAITALVLRAFVADSKYTADTDFVKKGYDRLLSFQLDNGGIYRDLLANYNTAIAVSALAAANKPEFQTHINRGVAYLRGLQWTPETRPEYAGGTNDKVPEANKGQQVVKDDKDTFFGGWGYGGRSRGGGRPDLSNAQLTLDALRDAGLKPDDPAFQNALKFVSRLQNNSETNDQKWAGNDGGFVYGPADTRLGESMAGESTTPEGERRLRSYGSMTYAGLKSFIYAGLSREDPRVKAAWKWVNANWTLDENPGMSALGADHAQHGLYYYYHTLSRALHEYDQPTLTTPDGKTVDWRIALIDKLASLQQPDGSWKGEAKWMEGNPVLVTSYVVAALQEAQKDLKQHPPK